MSFSPFFQSANLHAVQFLSVLRKAADLQAFLPMVFPFCIQFYFNRQIPLCAPISVFLQLFIRMQQ